MCDFREGVTDFFNMRGACQKAKRRVKYDRLSFCNFVSLALARVGRCCILFLRPCPSARRGCVPRRLCSPAQSWRLRSSMARIHVRKLESTAAPRSTISLGLPAEGAAWGPQCAMLGNAQAGVRPRPTLPTLKTFGRKSTSVARTRDRRAILSACPLTSLATTQTLAGVIGECTSTWALACLTRRRACSRLSSFTRN